MKLKRRLFSTGMILGIIYTALALTASSCDDAVVEPEPPAPGDLPVRTASDIPADTANEDKTTYFRFSDSSIVTGADTATGNWDIGFKGTAVWINGGAVRSGNGGAIVQTGSNFDTVSTAPTSGYGVDTSNTQLAIPTGSGNGWYVYNFATNVISPKPGAVLIVKCGDGKYAKVEIKSYYKGGVPNSTATNFRFYTFSYVYQPDGSTTIK